MVTLASALESSADRVPDRTAVVCGDLRQTYADLDRSVNQVAKVLTARGLGRGDRCALVGENTPGFIYALFATAKLGAIFVPVNPRSAPPEVAHILRDSGAKVFLMDPSTAEIGTAAVGLLAGEAAPTMLTLGSSRDLSLDLEDVLSASRAQPDDRPGVEVAEDDDAMILYTSGTTGLAKGVLMDHHRLIWTGVTVPIATIAMTEGASLLHMAPLYHAGQLTMMLIPGMLVGAKHVVLDAFDPVTVLDTMERERTSVFFGVPTMYQFMLAEQQRHARDLSAWRSGIYGAAPMPAEVAVHIAATFSGVRLFSCYGQTEAGPSGLFASPEEALRRPDVTGYRGFPGMLVRVVNAEGNPVLPGEVGEVLLRGETVMKGYWQDLKATAETVVDGWLHTGDLARLDVDGGITIVDRLKDMIISGGRNIYGVEVENALASHPAVADCAVIGRPNTAFGESVLAVVTLAAGVVATAEELREHCAARIADYKVPREFVFGAVPRNPSGKILKRDLRSTLALAD